ncbi:hypothetical protein XELAEV_18010613mg [Xenopus laevis]|uniref:Uncharacterized protein n=1 Tax=Xenopus laevis TaxID=8355 RepID=A0A974DW65_XENLA|nr:hypothetical protein XELAEV_18010613mg [Xenopus laevis]
MRARCQCCGPGFSIHTEAVKPVSFLLHRANRTVAAEYTQGRPASGGQEEAARSNEKQRPLQCETYPGSPCL